MQVNILKQLPTSLQVLQTLKNLQKLSPLNLSSPTFKSTLKTYAQQHLVIYKSQSPTQSSTQSSTQSQSPLSYSCYLHEQRNGQYYINQLTNEQIKVQSLDGAIVERKLVSEELKLSQNHHKLITLLQQKLSTYIDLHYAQPSAITCHFNINKQTQTIEQITIGITSKLNNVDNYYSGQTVSYWKFHQNQYTALITAANHFYENGNLIFARQKPIQKEYQQNPTIHLPNLNETEIDKIVNVIKKQQQSYQKQLQKLFTKKCSQALKKIRRITPLTQNKMIWNLNAVKMNQEINIQLPKMTL